MNIYIKALEYYLPEKIISNKDLELKFPDWTDEKIFGKVGICNRHIAAESETATDMAIKAAESLFSKYPDEKEKIDFILFCTQSPEYKLPTSACIIQSKLGISNNSGALDFNLGCSGYIYGLSLSKGLISSGSAKNVLLLTAETYSKYIADDDKGNKSLFGDAATATIISTEGFAKIGNFEFGTDGNGAEQLILRENEKLYMNGQNIFQFTLKRVPEVVVSVLKKNDLENQNIDLFVFHQANVFILEYLRKKLKISEDRFFYFIENVGNTVSNSIPIALKEALKKDFSGKKILLCGFGVGLSWGGCILEIENDSSS